MNTAFLRRRSQYLIYLLCFSATTLFPQSPSGTAVVNSVRPNTFTNNALDRTLWNISFEKKLSPEARKKLFYFDSWETKGTINGKYKIENVNYSLYDDALAYKMAEDSVFLFNKENVEAFMIAHKSFKRYYLGKDIKNTYLEILYSSTDKKIQLLKRQYLTTEKGDVDPLMMKKTTIKVIGHKEYYLVKDGGYPLKTRLNKKDILSKFPQYKKELQSFVSSEKLSFRKEEDLSRILNYLAKINAEKSR